MNTKKSIIMIFLSLGTLLAIVLSYFGWKDVYELLHYPERAFMYETFLLVSYVDFTLLSILGSISIVSILCKRKIWIPLIKCIIVNVGMWMILGLAISTLALFFKTLLGISLISIFSLLVWGMFKLWEFTNACRSEFAIKVNDSYQQELNRFIDAQEDSYNIAIEEIRAGKKETHWIWYIFPQMKGLGHSLFADLYGIVDIMEAKEYLKNDTLGYRLREVTNALLEIDGKSAEEIFGELDAMKVKSCLTLFDQVSPNGIFAETINKYFEGKRCELTIRLLAENEKLEKREPFNWKRFLKKALGVTITIGLLITLITRLVSNSNGEDIFKCIDTRLGIENTDYRVVRQSYHIYGFQDPSMVQKIKLNARGREIVNQYVLSYQTNLSRIGQVSEHINKAYKPKIDYRTAHLDNSLGDSHSLENYSEILEDSEDAYVRMQTSQVGRYFEQFCWLGGDYWKIILDTKTGVIYREYGSI